MSGTVSARERVRAQLATAGPAEIGPFAADVAEMLGDFDRLAAGYNRLASQHATGDAVHGIPDPQNCPACKQTTTPVPVYPRLVVEDDADDPGPVLWLIRSEADIDRPVPLFTKSEMDEIDPAAWDLLTAGVPVGLQDGEAEQ